MSDRVEPGASARTPGRVWVDAGRQELEKRLREAAFAGKAHLAVAVGPMGQPMIEGLWVDGEPISLAEPEQADPPDARITTADPG